MEKFLANICKNMVEKVLFWVKEEKYDLHFASFINLFFRGEGAPSPTPTSYTTAYGLNGSINCTMFCIHN